MRLPMIGAGLPAIYWHDEYNFIEGALRIGSAGITDVSFGGYGHGTLTYFLLFGALGLFFAVGRLTGAFAGSDDFVQSYLLDPSAVFLVARTVMLAASVGVVYVTYLVGRRLVGRAEGIVAALLCGMSFHLIHVTFGKEDVLFTFFLVLAAWPAATILDRQETRSGYLLTGAVLGAAAAVKYLALFGVVIPLVAAILGGLRGMRLVKAMTLTGFTCILTFVCLVPGVLIDTGNFVAWVLRLFGENTGTLMATLQEPSPWFRYLWGTYAGAGGIALTSLFYAGVITAAWTRSRRLLIVVAYPVTLTGALATLAFFGGATPVTFYQVSTIPFLAVAAAWVVCKAWRRWSLAGRAVLVGLLAAATVANVGRIVKFNRLLASEDTRTIAREWIEGHVPAGASVLVEGAVFTFILEAPQLRDNAASLERDIADIRDRGGSGRLWQAKLDMLQRGLVSGPTYDLYKVYHLGEEDLAGASARFVITREPSSKRIVEKSGRYRLVHSVEPTEPNAFYVMPMLSLVDLERINEMTLFDSSEARRIGPPIGIYEARGVEQP
ncbi:MAG: glycosyltransferase family 39 protein [SAR202 cluster bacterium]|nr:glycosyltransferase family 39 protein [SAR202 cluster bacterium]MDP6662999.1 glycosyltransferase family 39 protein [SAR202 cluster bacterium]